MGKDFFSPKAIANRIKAKGLQKLKFYCQMCAKQCRDENGFKCHCLSESHQRQMALFAENPDKFLDVFSESFEEAFLELLSRRYNTRRVHANQVYNEYIQDKEHTHMNSTIWPTLTDFVKYLGRTGKCVIDETEKGWHIQWINRDPEVLRRQAEREQRNEAELDDAARHELELEAQAAAAREAALAELFNSDDEGDGDEGNNNGSSFAAPAYTALLRDSSSGAAPVKIKLGGTLAAGSSSGSSSSNGALNSNSGVSTQPPSLISLSGGAGIKRKRFDLEGGDDPFGAAKPAAAPASAPASSSSSSSTTTSVSGAPLSMAARLIQEDLRLKAKAAAPGGGGKPSRFDAPAIASSSSAAALPVHPSPSALASSSSAPSSSSISSSSSASAAAASSKVPIPPSPSDCWVVPGLVVKVMNAKVGGGAFFKKKGAVLSRDASSPYVAVVRMMDGSGATLKVDQEQLETVIPSPGGRVLLLAPPHRGSVGELLRIDEQRFCASVRLLSGGGGGGGAVVVEGVEYEHLCKYEPQ